MLKNLLARLREPSTWSGLAVLAILAGAKSETVQAIQAAAPHIVDGVTVAFGLGAVLIGEKK